MKNLAILILLIMSASAHAQSALDPGLFVNALKSGSATHSLPQQPEFNRLAQKLQQQTGSDGAIEIDARLINRFKQQARCGRVAFALVQPTSRHVWPQFGGQLNICEDGLPPWQVCKENPKILVPLGSKCVGNANPENTPEIGEAIQIALANGGLSGKQVAQKMKERMAKGDSP